MNIYETTPQLEHIMQQIDRLIAEMTSLRGQVAALNSASVSAQSSVRQAEYFGMWADREDMAEQSSRTWLEKLRSQQWAARQ